MKTETKAEILEILGVALVIVPVALAIIIWWRAEEPVSGLVMYLLLLCVAAGASLWFGWAQRLRERARREEADIAYQWAVKADSNGCIEGFGLTEDPFIQEANETINRVYRAFLFPECVAPEEVESRRRARMQRAAYHRIRQTLSVRRQLVRVR